MKKLIILLVVLATSCNQEASSKFSMHNYIGEYKAKLTVNWDMLVRECDASLYKKNGQYYLKMCLYDPFQLDGKSRKNIIRDTNEGGDVDVKEIYFDKNIEVLRYWLTQDPSRTVTDSIFLTLEKPHQN